MHDHGQVKSSCTELQSDCKVIEATIPDDDGKYQVSIRVGVESTH